MTADADYGAGWHEQALDLADDCKAFAEIIPSPVCRSKLHAAANSLRWQVQWERNHPSPTDGSTP